jgi:type I protein arginine methyltransferase
MEHTSSRHMANSAAGDAGSGSTDDDGDYFAAYTSAQVHALMIRDVPRTEAYARALGDGQMEGKVVLDAGCGTGILSLLAAREGRARHVYAVEGSQLADITEMIVEHNGLGEQITVVSGDVGSSDLRLPSAGGGAGQPGEPLEEHSVDVLVSEWMGFYLLHESMLGSVLDARDRWLRPGGQMLPARARILAAPVETMEFYRENIGFWGEEVYGFDMSAMLGLAMVENLETPQILSLTGDAVLAEPAVVADLDLATVTKAELEEISRPLEFTATRAGQLHGVACWFDCAFGPEQVLDTSPSAPPTHWKQTVVLLPEVRNVVPGDVIRGQITLRQNPLHYRRYEVLCFPRCLSLLAFLAADTPPQSSQRSRLRLRRKRRMAFPATSADATA